MQLRTEPRYGQKPETEAVSSFIESACRRASQGTHGQVECVSDEHNALAEMFGKLVDLLASRGQLSADDIVTLAGQQYSVDRAELLPETAEDDT
jgi:hypothetical protein